MSSPTPPTRLASQSYCFSVLDEVLHLVSTPAVMGASRERLNFLLLNYFQDDKHGAAFRSMICYGTDHQLVSMHNFNKFIIQPHSQFEMHLVEQQSNVPFQFRPLPSNVRRELQCTTLIHAHAMVDFVLEHVTKQHPESNAILSFRSLVPTSWKNCIIGNLERSQLTIVDVPSLQELQLRIRQALSYALTQKKTNPRSHFFSTDSGLVWKSASAPDRQVQENAMVNYEEAYLRACSQFPAHLSSILKDQYLDLHAGVFAVASTPPEVVAKFRKMMDQAPPPHVQGIDLKLGKGSESKIGGTIIALHQYLSPEFLAYYTVDHDASCAYMADIRSGHKKQRKIRVSSVHHVNTQPIWLQFGETNDVYLYLSQKATVAEEAWLKIVNHVMKLLVDFVNQDLKKTYGKNIPRNKLLRVRSFGSAVSSISHPKDGNYGPHDDGKPGTASRDNPDYSLFQLMVATLCIQNYCHTNTRISWCPKNDLKFTAGEVEQECILIHIQAVGVQEYFKHHISTNNSSIPSEAYFGFEVDVAGDDNGGEEAYNEGVVQELSYAMHLDEKSLTVSVAEKDREDSQAVDTNMFIRPWTPPQPKRLVSSARETYPLQSSGLKQILDDLSDRTMISEPQVYGLNQHYEFLNVWGATSDVHHRQLGTRNSVSILDASLTPTSTFREVFSFNEQRKKRPLKDIVCDLTKYLYTVRSTDKPIWPKSNEKKVVSVKTAAVMMTSRPMVDWLRSDGVIPVIRMPNRDGGIVDIPFGPYFGGNNEQPQAIGTCFHAASIYRHFGMNLHKDHNTAWRSNSDTTSAFIIRLPEKNSLPLDLPQALRKSPYAEMRRIMNKEPLEGFDLYRSGGNGSIKGLAPPGPGSKTAGEGAFLEHEQTINNPFNFALEVVCELGRPLAVFGAGDIFPENLYDQTLAGNNGNEEQAFYYGCYRVLALGERPALIKRDIIQIMEEYNTIYPNLDYTNFRFLLKPHRAYRLVPLDYKYRDGGYRHLVIDIRDTRRPTFEVPNKVSFQKAFGSIDDSSIDETTLLKKWYDGGGHYRFINSPFTPTTERAFTRRRNALKKIDWEGFESLGVTESPFRLVPPNNDKGTVELSEFDTVHQTVDENWSIVTVCSIASFLRMCEVNVDSTGHIGPLMDLDPSYHIPGSGSDLSNYIGIFGSNKTKYMDGLGLEIQRSPLTHPVRTYDPNRIYLIESSGGGGMRVKRKGVPFMQNHFLVSVDLLFQSFLVEVVRVQILMEWSLSKHGGVDPHLPLISDMESLLEFIDCLREENGWRTTRHLLQTQYEIHDAFKSTSAFTRILKFIAVNFAGWLRRTVDAVDQYNPTDDNRDMFNECVTSLAQLLSGDQALGNSGVKLPFFCQHVLSNVNELFDGWPLGKPKKAILGFGGRFGASRIQGGLPEKKSLQDVLGLITEGLSKRTNKELGLVGLSRDDEGVIVVKENGRPVTCLDSEHWCCISFGFTERRPGGTRGVGVSYEVSSPHCHPIRSAMFPKQLALSVLKNYQAQVDSGEWQSLMVAYNQTTDRAETFDITNESPDPIETFDGGNESSDDENSSLKHVTNAVHRKRPPSPIFVTQSPTAGQAHTLTSDNDGVNLMLGMIYGSLYGEPEAIATKTSHTSQLRRDTARCVATEQLFQRPVYTLDNRDGESNRPDRHIRMDMMRIDLEHALLKSIAGTIHQICLDHFWFVPAYWDEKGAGEVFFSRSLPQLGSLLKEDGSIYLGLCVQMFARLAKNKVEIEAQFLVRLVLHTEVKEINLVSGSHTLPDNLYRSKSLGYKDPKPELKFGISYHQIQQTVGSSLNVDPKSVSDYLKELVGDGQNPENYAFIQLKQKRN